MNIVKLLGKIENSKSIKRTGWVRENVSNPESVADHSFGVVAIAMILGPQLNVDEEKLIRMAIIHDLGESETGDVVTDRGGKTDVGVRRKKEKKEGNAINRMFEDLPDGKRYLSLFHEMIERKTKEARIFKQIDKLDMALQALEYEKTQGLDMTEFFVDAEVYIVHPILKEIFEELKSRRSNPSHK